MDEPDDELPALIAGLDQFVSLAPHLARTIRGIFNAFVAEGFSDSQACYLAMSQVLQNPGSPP